MALSSTQKQALVAEGYTVLPCIIPALTLMTAQSHIDAAYANNKYKLRESDSSLPSFFDAVQKHQSVLNLVRETALHDTLKDLLGGYELLGSAGQIAFRPPDATCPTPRVSRTAWHVDEGPRGKYVSAPSSFSLLLGIALSDQTADADVGQLNVWPRSHYVTHPPLCDRLRRFRGGASPNERFRDGRPNVGVASRVRMGVGDAVLVHQRVAHCGGPNGGSDIRKTVYFRVRGTDHEEVVSRWADGAGVWAGFRGLERLGVEV